MEKEKAELEANICIMERKLSVRIREYWSNRKFRFQARMRVELLILNFKDKFGIFFSRKVSKFIN